MEIEHHSGKIHTPVSHGRLGKAYSALKVCSFKHMECCCVSLPTGTARTMLLEEWKSMHPNCDMSLHEVWDKICHLMLQKETVKMELEKYGLFPIQLGLAEASID